MWNRNSRVTASLLVYAFSRYSILTQVVLSIATNFPMSDTVSDLVINLLFDALIVVCAEVRSGSLLPWIVLRVLRPFPPQ